MSGCQLYKFINYIQELENLPTRYILLQQFLATCVHPSGTTFRRRYLGEVRYVPCSTFAVPLTSTPTIPRPGQSRRQPTNTTAQDRKQLPSALPGEGPRPVTEVSGHTSSGVWEQER
ncbi:hypothetical protein FALCPG4_015442 [Fusarium falciforme]